MALKIADSEHAALGLVRRSLGASSATLFFLESGRTLCAGEPAPDTVAESIERLGETGAGPGEQDGWLTVVDAGVPPRWALAVQAEDIGSLRERLDAAAPELFLVLKGLAEARRARAVEERSRSVLSNLETMADLGIWQVDLQSNEIAWSDVTYQIHGVERGEFTPNMDNALNFYPEEVRGLVASNIEAAITSGRSFSFVLPLRRADDKLRTVRAVGTVLRDADTRHLFGIFQDITEIKEAEQRLWWTANHDVLTGLPNRMLFQERLDSALAAASAEGRCVGLILVDLDQFKSINDIYGHEAGDEVLKIVAERLGAQMRHGDTLARLGGDEFAIIVNDLATADALARPLKRLVSAADIDFAYRNIAIPVKLSLGAAVFPNDASDEQTLYRNADLALFETKADRDRRSTLYHFTHGLERAGREWNLRRMRAAVLSGAIKAHFQPVFDLRTGRIASVEAMARWQEGKETLEASSLRPAFEDPELAPLIGLDLLKQLKSTWLTLDPSRRRSILLSLSVSARELQNLHYVEALLEFVNECAGEALDLVLELGGDPARILPETVRPTFQKIIDAGLSFGFGSLAAGFEALVESPALSVRQIKAHKSTLTDPAAETRAAPIIGGMINTCRTLGVHLIATEIEERADLERLRKLGYSLGQGCYFTEALSFDDLTDVLDEAGEPMHLLLAANAAY